MEIREDPLFIGLTRPPMIFGVPYNAVVAMTLCVAIAFIMTKSFKVILIYPVLHSVCYLITLKDPNTFRLMAMFYMTKMRSLSRNYWKVSTSSQHVNTRANNRSRRTWL